MGSGLRLEVGDTRWRRVGVAAGVVIAVCALAAALLVPSLLKAGGGNGPVPVPGALTGSMLPRAVAACSQCHTIPPPDTLPRERWAPMIRHMAALIEQYQLGPAIPAGDVDEVIRYYESLAPTALPALRQTAASGTGGFLPGPLGDPPSPPGAGAPPIIGNVTIVDLNGDGHLEVLVCDTGRDAVTWIAARDRRVVESLLGKVPTPVRTALADMNKDGRTDIVVASLGSIKPTEDPVGSVWVLSLRADGYFDARPILTGAPRVSDAQPGDLDGDGDLDVAVAEFGMFKTGGVTVLEQSADGAYVPHRVMQLNGTSHVPIADLDADRRPDILALVSQQHERVVALVNRGRLSFDPVTIYQAPHPLYGMAWLEPADLDRDGDTDAIVANGDALDRDPYPKPYHGLQWLENTGGLRFEFHDIARFYGAYSAAVGDLDGDGDLDIVSTSMMNVWDDPACQSVVWFENDGRQRFTLRPISASPTYQVTAAVGDLDGDRRPDIVTAGMYVFEPYHRVGRITMWANRLGR